MATIAATRRLLTFPTIRQHLDGLTDMAGVRPALLFVSLFMLTLPYVALRAMADNWRAAADGATAERALFGSLPTLALQHALHGGEFGPLERAAVYVHISWFFVPAAATLLVAIRYRSEFWSYAGWYLATMYAAVIVFILLPVSPPWMVDAHVTRIVALNWSEVHIDDNPSAAFPSLHVALPLAISVWSLAHQHRRLGIAMLAFSGLTALNVVFLGEHYVIDVLASVALVAVIAACARLTRQAARRPSVRAVWAQAGERGQNLVEFALMFPAILLFIGVIVVFGLMLNTRSNLQQAVREGARQAAVGKSLAEVQTLAAGNSNSTLAPADVQWCFPNGTGKVGDPVEVFILYSGDSTAGYPYQMVPSGGTFNKVFGASLLTVRMGPTATTRLEASVSSATVSAAKACPT